MPDRVGALDAAGLANPQRAVRVMREAIAAMSLDLRGLEVFTEIGSGSYLTTPFIAAMANAAQVCAIVRDSAWGSVAAVATAGTELGRLCDAGDRVTIVTEKTAGDIGRCDIVTNLGFVRPLDRATVSMMKRGAVIPLMCEAWEFRDGDVDLDACRERQVSVVATNEDQPGLEVFDFSGPLCVKLLFEAGVEVHKSRVVVVSGDKFGAVIARALRAVGAEVHLAARVDDQRLESVLPVADALVIADYCSLDLFIGSGGQMDVERLARLAPGIAVIPFAGRVDAAALEAAGVWCLPGSGGAPLRMARTFAHLGVKPVVDLHAAGLKVAEIAARIPFAQRTEEKLQMALGAHGCPVVRGAQVHV